MECFHGTKSATAKSLIAGNVDVSQGGGELGQGFYTGDYLWVAKAWAANRYKKDAAVVKFEIPDTEYFALKPLLLCRTDALKHRNDIKAASATRTYRFKVHVVWSPIVGTTRVDADQHKFEDKKSESLLNGSLVPRLLA